MTADPISRLTAALSGRYRIERELGEGGMATVYLAEDLRHERKVALKVLKPELAAVLGGERFLTEIKTTANLQHPHILPLFDSGEVDGFLYYVMPYIEGETLRDRIDREGQLGVDDAVEIARDVADALDYAHRNHIIHRDIKPANVLLHDGRPVVADFGIALAVSAAGGGRMTETGLSLGTPHYMSPEQASADRDLSARSDVYSLGCVLYEMLAGQPPHTGPSAQNILVRILTEDPRHVKELRRTVPPHVAAAVMKSIEKLPADRFDTARELMDALGNEAFRYQPLPTGTVGGAAPSIGLARGASSGRLPRSVPWVLAGSLAVLAYLGWSGRSGDGPRPVVRFDIDLERDLDAVGRNVTISPDGSTILVSALADGESRLFLRGMDEVDFRRLSGTDRGIHPTFSPDGEWIAFSAAGDLWRVHVGGGSPVLLAEGARGPSWETPGTIVYQGDDGIYAVPAQGGDARPILHDTTVFPDPGPGFVSHPHMLPDESGLLFTRFDADVGTVMVLDFDTDEVREIGPGDRGQYLETGHVLYVDSAGMGFVVPFDLRTRSVTGGRVRVLSDVAWSGSEPVFTLSDDGTLVHGDASAPDTTSRGLTGLRWVDSLGDEQGIPAQVTAPILPRVSPDGERVALVDSDHIWIHDTRTGATRQFTFEGRNGTPLWSADGSRLFFSSEREGTLGLDGFVKPADGSADPSTLWRYPGDQQLISSSPDGRWLIVSDGSDFSEYRLMLADLAADTVALVPYLPGVTGTYEGNVSPNGRFMAYTSTELEGEPEQVWVRGFPDPQGRWRVSTRGGYDPRWSADGSRLFFTWSGTLYAVAVSTATTFTWEDPKELLTWPYHPGGGPRIGYDIGPDGRFVVAPRLRGRWGFLRARVVVNWHDELREILGDEGG